MSVNFKFEVISTIFLLKDYQGNVVKVSKEVPNSFYFMEYLGNDILGNATYYDDATGLVWSKKSTPIVIGKFSYFQEEYTDITYLWEQNHKQQIALETDELTQVSNLKAVKRKQQEILEAGNSCVLAMCDMNNFKSINDNFGHVIGDECLIKTAAIFKNFISREDLVARIGGDEFLFIFLTDNIESIKEKMALIQENVKTLGEALNLPLSVSTGVALFKKGDDWEQKKAEADSGSYRDKELIKKLGCCPKS